METTEPLTLACLPDAESHQDQRDHLLQAKEGTGSPQGWCQEGSLGDSLGPAPWVRPRCQGRPLPTAPPHRQPTLPTRCPPTRTWSTPEMTLGRPRPHPTAGADPAHLGRPRPLPGLPLGGAGSTPHLQLLGQLHQPPSRLPGSPCHLQDLVIQQVKYKKPIEGIVPKYFR